MSARLPRPLGALGIAVVALVCLPLVYLVVRVAGGGAAAWDVLERPRTLELIARTLGLVGAVTAAAVAIGVPAAWLVTRTDLPGRRVWAVLLALPLVLPSYVLALALLAVSGPGGLLGLPSLVGFPGSLLALALATYPYVLLVSAAALRRLDPGLEEAARSLGRTRAQAIRAVALPALRPAVAAGALLAALYALSDFGVVSLMRYDALTRAVFLQYQALFDRTPAAVLGLLLVALTVLVLLGETWARGRAERPGAAASRPARPVRLRRWTVPALLFCLAVVGAALVLPVGVLVYWIARAPAAAAQADGMWAAAANSLLVSLVAAGATVLAALPVALLAVRFRRPWTLLLERASYIGNALPGVVIALALVFFAANYATFAYGTLAVLLLAYLVRFLPQALAAARAALARADPRLEEAARGLGRPPARTYATVTVPLVAPGLLAAATLVFLSTIKELPATLLLRPIGFDTLPVEIWTATSVSAYARAAPPALLLCLIAAPVVWLLVARGGHGLDELG